MSPIKLVESIATVESDVELTDLDKRTYAQKKFVAEAHNSGKSGEADKVTQGEDSKAEESIIKQVIDESHFGYMLQHPVDWAFSMLTGKPIVEDRTEGLKQREELVATTSDVSTPDESSKKKNFVLGIIIAALVVVVGYELYGSLVSPVPHLWSYPRKKKGVVRFIVNGPYKTSISLVDTSVVWWIIKRNKCKFSIGNKQKELSRLVAHESLSFYINKNRCYVTSVEMMENCRVAMNFVTIHETQLVESRLVSTSALGSVDAFVDK